MKAASILVLTTGVLLAAPSLTWGQHWKHAGSPQQQPHRTVQYAPSAQQHQQRHHQPAQQYQRPVQYARPAAYCPPVQYHQPVRHYYRPVYAAPVAYAPAGLAVSYSSYTSSGGLSLSYQSAPVVHTVYEPVVYQPRPQVYVPAPVYYVPRPVMYAAPARACPPPPCATQGPRGIWHVP